MTHEPKITQLGSDPRSICTRKLSSSDLESLGSEKLGGHNNAICRVTYQRVARALGLVLEGE